MADSLREQLLQAGFKQPKSEPVRKKQKRSDSSARKSRHSTSNSAVSSQPAANRPKGKTEQAPTKKQVQHAAAEQRRVIKAQIKKLIEAGAVKDVAGEIAYRYTLQNRIRELHITEAIRQQLVAGTLVVTRLNGATYLIPENTALEIRKLNSNWVIVKPGDSSADPAEGYDDFPVPDDLIW